ncbi:MAG: Smr/MutS family protein [Pseudomonadota bacterium]
MKGRRDLRPGERALWDKIARSVTPLGGRRAPVEAPEPPAPAPAPVKKANGAAAKKPPRVRAPDPGPLDRKDRRKIAKGETRIEGRIDLHGMTQEEAHSALTRFILAAAAADKRLVLVITGKGRGEGGEGSGVLRRSVPHWLGQRTLKPLIVSLAEAHVGHGGSGALYVRLRAMGKRRPK